MHLIKFGQIEIYVLRCKFKVESNRCLNDTRLLDPFVHLDQVSFLKVGEFFQSKTALCSLACLSDFLLKLSHCVQCPCFGN